MEGELGRGSSWGAWRRLLARPLFLPPRVLHPSAFHVPHLCAGLCAGSRGPHVPRPGRVGGWWMQKAPWVLVNRSKNCLQVAEVLCRNGNRRWCLKSYRGWGAALARQAVWGVSEELPLSPEPTCVRRGEREGTHPCRRGCEGLSSASPGVETCPAHSVQEGGRGSGQRQVGLEGGKGRRATVRKGGPVGKPLRDGRGSGVLWEHARGRGHKAAVSRPEE